jgi:hypothetical protein
MGIFTVATVSLASLLASTAFAQQSKQGAASIPDFSGMWGHLSLGLEPPQSGPGPVLNKSRLRQIFDDNGRRFPAANAAPLVSDPSQWVGDYANPILKPWAGNVVKKHGEIELSGRPAPNPTNQCWPSGVPYVFWNLGMQLLQQPDKITILYAFDHEVRHVRLNQSHPAQLRPSWFDSVGHYEGDALVIDTVGIKTSRFAMVDHYGTPHTEALHVIERYRLIDYAGAKDALARDAKENFLFNPASIDSPLTVDPTFRGMHLQLELTIDDEGAFTTPWSATITYRPASGVWSESVCAENPHELSRQANLPTADNPDF